MKKFTFILFIVLGLFTLTGCIVRNTEKDVEIILEINSEVIEIVLGESYTLTPTVSNVKDPKFIYETTQNHIFTVANGVITPITIGEGTITIKIDGYDVSKDVKVKIVKKEEPIVEKKELKITAEKTELAIEDNIQLSLNKELTGNIKWFSTNPSVLTVDNNGLATAVALGDATIVILSENETAAIKLEVVGDGYNGDEITDELVITGATSVQLSHKIKLQSNSQNIEWKSLNEEIATISAEGVVTTIAPGEVLIEGYDKNKELKSTYKVLVKDEQLIQVDFTEAKFYLGEEHKITPNIFGFTNPAIFKFTSENRMKLKVTDKGEILGMSLDPVKATVSLASCENIKVIINFTFIPYPTITMTPTTGNIKVGSTTSFLSTILNLDNKEVEWSVDDENVATISEDGVLTGVSVGVVTVTVKSKAIPTLVARGTIEIAETDSLNLRNEIVRIALAEVGYKEGTNNSTKYGEWYNLQNQPWCAMFVSWSAHQAGVPITVILKYAGVSVGQEWFRIKGEHHYKTAEQTRTGEYVPICGDIIFFTSNGASHTGLVIKVVGDTLYTVEGNTSDMVAIRTYKYKTHNTITGYGVPAYPASSTPIEDFDISGSSSGGGQSTT